jgi:hypothetical protein
MMSHLQSDSMADRMQFDGGTILGFGPAAAAGIER